MRALLVSVLLATFLQGGGQPISIPIENPSFEVMHAPPVNPYVTQCGVFVGDVGIVEGWSGNGGVFTPANPNPCLVDLPPSGARVLYVGYGSTAYQDLKVKPSDLQAVSRDGMYVVTFSVANVFTVYPGYYEAKLYLGTLGANGLINPGAQELCSTDGWAKWHFSEVPLVCPSPGYLVYDQIFPNFPADGAPLADPNAHLILSLYGGSWIVMVDDVAATFTPTP